ncbi:MAG: SRPBCC domain-containing protein [Propionibacteriaceae bacterium]|jgi:uncharacterized protein YndB with AHSA1/START domain|nr:SRPBCC domain-containing protein [Propionibacteriaceae bacterium]
MLDQVEGDTLVNPVDTTVTANRSVSQPIKEVWKLLVTREGAEALLGVGAELGDKGDSWHAADGTFGVVRSYHPLEQIRFTWHPAEDTPTTIVEVDLSAEESGTRLEITHQHIPTYFDTAALARRWEQALDRLTAATA